jgi:hypothetical protein
MNPSLMNWLLFKFILGQIDRYLIHFEKNRPFEKDFDCDFKAEGLYDMDGNHVTFNAIQRHREVEKKLQAIRLAAYRCQILFFIKQNRFF